jgi:hypothetical protein
MHVAMSLRPSNRSRSIPGGIVPNARSYACAGRSARVRQFSSRDLAFTRLTIEANLTRKRPRQRAQQPIPSQRRAKAERRRAIRRSRRQAALPRPRSRNHDFRTVPNLFQVVHDRPGCRPEVVSLLLRAMPDHRSRPLGRRPVCDSRQAREASPGKWRADEHVAG